MDVKSIWHAISRRWSRDDRPDVHEEADPAAAQRFLVGLGSALLSVGVATTDIHRTLHGVARALGYEQASIIVLPTVMIISLTEASERGLAATEPHDGEVRFDRASGVYQLVLAAQRGELTAEEGLDRLAAIQAEPPRFRWPVRIIGHGVAASGVALILLGADLTSMIGALLLGSLVGAAKLVVRPNSFSATLLPAFMSFLTALLVFAAAEAHLLAVPLQVLVPALVTLLPGAALTTGIQELAAGDMISGSSRLVSGAIQLVLLAFGIIAALTISGLAPSRALQVTGPGFGAFEPWVGVILMALGFFLYYCGPPRAVYFLTVTLFAAYGAQVLSALIVPAVFSGFVGALVLTVVAYLLQSFRGAPPAVVCFLPAFWLLVPGAAGLIDFTQKVLGLALETVNTFSVLGSIVAIALGVVTGTAVYRQIYRLAPSRWGLRFS
ncbi:threonine/serine exporter family protein [Microterricola viridarii]|uniref:Uncharacterized membrane protein YjjP, DUF1212 family n=1 Tax=Microterricola viridarii TaxID=412690 RepID=A0A1H1V6Y3_9MICO|nr:threonine/serine exporter family protein [Microterricola viridarii]SDS80136.1 Uncharacterized membrane protein YjjP, DUF1212 family [Microterricola viridarii]